MKYDVTCVGIIVADTLAKPVEKIPQKGKLELVEKISLFTGGCAVNTAVDLSKIGLKTAVVGKVGDDGFGQFILSSLRAQNVNTDGIVSDQNASTSASVVLSNADGERSFIHSLGANALFTETDIDYDVIRNSAIVFVAGSLLMPGFDGEGCSEFLRKSRELGKITALDTAWDPKEGWMKSLAPVIPYVDYFMPSYDEAVKLSGETELEKIAGKFLSMGPKVVVIKNGKHGCYIQSAAGEKLTVPTYTRVRPVDTNGAGDSFCAGFLTGIAKRWSLAECGRFANAVGTCCVMEAGASTGIRSEAETRRFMREYEHHESEENTFTD